jgi:hypothetical protein
VEKLSFNNEELNEIYGKIADLNNLLHAVLNTAKFIRFKVKESGTSFEEIKFSEERLKIIEESIEKYKNFRGGEEALESKEKVLKQVFELESEMDQLVARLFACMEALSDKLNHVEVEPEKLIMMRRKIVSIRHMKSSHPTL